MPLRFNYAGPCIPGEHYMVPPEARVGRVMELIDQGNYFTLHAGRQTGKTTSIQWLVDYYNRRDDYFSLWIDLESAREQPDLAKAMRTVIGTIERWRELTTPKLAPLDVEALLLDPSTALNRGLSQLAASSTRPFVVLFDEADGLVGEAMVSFLTQLRTGYISRKRVPFPHSVALVGMRQVRDYALSTEDRRPVSWLGTTSPFNITAEAATIRLFSPDEVAGLLKQHEQATGQLFTPAAVERIWHFSQGHPWLVNALAAQVVHEDVKDRGISVTPGHVDRAKETLIVERRTNIDSLVARLREPRVQRILSPMLAGDPVPGDILDDDLAYVLGLGIVRINAGRLEIANPIYREVIPRALTYVQQVSLNQETAWYVRRDGSLDLPKLFAAWQIFWRNDGHLAAEGFGYREAGPHLMLMAFLQRILNGGGRIEREYGLGRGAMDLHVEWHSQEHAIEVKLRRDSETEEEACEQLARYLDSLGLNEGWLVLFDLRKELGWEAKLQTRELSYEGKTIHVVGC